MATYQVKTNLNAFLGFFFLFNFTLFSCKNKAQPFPKDLKSVEDIGSYYINQFGNVGLSIGIIDDTVFTTYHFGKVNSMDTTKPDDQSFYEIGSITKTFTSSLFFILKESGQYPKLESNDLIFEYTQNEKLKGITLYELTSHSSGLDRVPSNLLPSNPIKLIKASRDPYAEYTEEDFKAYLQDCKIKKRGSFNYSNTGAALLGLILQYVTQKDYYTLLREYLLQPLDMQYTAYPLDDSLVSKLMTPHTNRGAVTDHWNFKSLGAAGSLRSNTEEMLKYLDFWIHSNKSLPYSEQLRVNALEVVVKDEAMSIAQGWIFSKLSDGNEFYWHNGGTGGFRTFIGFLKNQPKGVVIMSNTTNQVDDAGIAILKFLSKEE